MGTLHVLHLEDNAADTFFVQRTLEKTGLDVSIIHASTRAEFEAGMENDNLDVILLDNALPGINGLQAIELARVRHPGVPVIVVSGSSDERQAQESLHAGACDYVLKNQLWQLPAAINRLRFNITKAPDSKTEVMMRLVSVVQELSLTRGLARIMEIVRKATRSLTASDGATFVLRKGDQCYYADEDAITPLWKGQTFPIKICVSGWAMIHRQPAVVNDIYNDPRIPLDVYKKTFVKSLVMVPIRTQAPQGAIGAYWANQHSPTTTEIEILQALANTTAVAMENVQLYSELEQRVQERTMQLQSANRELEAFSYSVSHDLRSPLCSIGGYIQLLEEESVNNLSRAGKELLDSARSEVKRMSGLIEDLLRLSKYTQIELKQENLDLSSLAENVAFHLRSRHPDRQVDFQCQPGLKAVGDAGLMSIVLENLLSNAWKYTSKREKAEIAFGSTHSSGSNPDFYVRDNGAGFDMKHAGKLFSPFQRLHSEDEFKGTGVGLATTQRIIHRHGGTIRAESAVNQGTTITFTLPARDKNPPESVTTK